MFLGSISLDSIANGITTWWFQNFNPNGLVHVVYYALQVQSNGNYLLILK
jgi:hypothetical protein